MPPRGIAFVLLAALLAGCLGDPASDDPLHVDPAAQGEYEEPVLVRPEARLKLFSFPLERDTAHEMWVNGSFEPQETGVGGGFLSGEFVKVIDLSDGIPVGVPTYVELEVTMDITEVPLVGPTGRADLVSNGTVWYESQWQANGPGHAELQGIVVRSASGQVGISLEAYLPGAASAPGMDYSIRMSARSQADVVPGGVPVALHLGANESIWFETLGEQHAEVLLYGPDDALVGRLYVVENERWRTPRGTAGEFVVMPVHGSGDLRFGQEVEDDSDLGPLRALGFRQEHGAPHGLQPVAATTWSFEVNERPLRVSVAVTGPEGEAWVCSGTVTVSLESPAGRVLQQAVDCPSPTNVPFLYEEEWMWWTDVGDPRLTPGGYEVTVEPALWSGFQAQHMVEWYER